MAQEKQTTKKSTARRAAGKGTRRKAERRSEPPCKLAIVGSECYPFVKTGGLGDVMYALPRALARLNCEIRVFLPLYSCIPERYRDMLQFKGEFMMDLCADGREFYVGLWEWEQDGLLYDFIDNQEFFSWGKPYTDLAKDIPKYCFFSKAVPAMLNYLEWIPDVVHCHDWQAALVPVYLRTLFAGTPVGNAKSVLTIHNLRFQGIHNIPTIQYWSGLPGYAFDYTTLKQGYEDANMFKGGLAYANAITTVSETYAQEIQTPFYGDGLDAHLRYHSNKLRGIVNGIDVEQWDSSRDSLLQPPYGAEDAIEKKRLNKLALQKELGLEPDGDKLLLGLISRLTDQKGLDLVNEIVPELLDGETQLVVLGTGEPRYEKAFRDFELAHPGCVSANILYDEALAHRIYAGTDALLVPSLFEPCGLTQLIAMRYGTIPIVRQTGGLKDTVLPCQEEADRGNGFCFDQYEAPLLLEAVNQAKQLYRTDRPCWDRMLLRDMAVDVSWDHSARLYRDLYKEL